MAVRVSPGLFIFHPGYYVFYGGLLAVHEDADALSLLESKLMRYGFIDLPEYREQKYVCSGKMRFRVDADFPRLTADNVAPQIIETQYSISLAGIEGWRMED